MKNIKNPHHAILGALYGQAVGDAMGMPSELWPLQKVSDYFGWITHFLPGPAENSAANGFIAGEYTDDTQQAVALMDALLAAEGRFRLMARLHLFRSGNSPRSLRPHRYEP